MTGAIRLIVITSPDQLDQEWINRLAREAEIEHLDRVGSVAAGVLLARQSRPDLVIVDRDVEQIESAIRQIFSYVPSTLCIAVTPSADVPTLRRLVMAGARDVINRPIHHSDIMNSIRSVVAAERDRSVRAASNSDQRLGRLVVVVAPKGGVGATTIAANLAIALRQVTNTSVALADMGLQFGDVGVQLNIWSRHTLYDLVMHASELDDALFEKVLQTHSSSIKVLLAPHELEAAGDISGDAMRAVLQGLLARHTYVVCDTWSFLDEVTETLLQKADDVLVVTTPEVPALRNTKSFLEHLTRNELTRGRITLVLNRFPSVNGIALQDVQKHLRYPVGANIPSEGQSITHSINRGVPIVMAQPHSWASQSLLRLAAYVAGDNANPISLQHSGNKKTGKFTLPGMKGRRSLLSLMRGT
ncbi:CpaE family protein [Roseiflexus sp.]|uniref:AAA family ATPase n=1 Tax=Roseiflexus sp. TaxID=2562120 RepID=UPI00398B93C2